MTYRINSLVPHLIYDNYFASSDNTFGYIPLYGEMGSDFYNTEVDHEEEELKLDKVKEKYLNKFVSLCKQNNIKLYFAVSPTANYSSDIYLYAKELSKRHKIPLIYYPQENSPFDNTRYFQDSSHMNDSGAHVYTNIIISKLNDTFN